jgi:hypothetical protein
MDMSGFLTHGEWVMSVLTLVYVVISFFGLMAIKRQADIAKSQSDAVMDAKRPLILIMWDNMVHINPEAENGVLSHCFQWTFKNCGTSPAFIEKISSRFVVIKSLNEFPPEPRYLQPREVLCEPEPLLPDQPSKPGVYSPVESANSFEELDASLRRKECFLYAYGFVRYRDIYQREHETRFGLVYESAPTPSIERDGFRLAGPAAYNRYT